MVNSAGGAKKLWGTENIEQILDEITQQIRDADRYGQWVETVVKEYVTKVQKRRNEQHSKIRLQENYADNAGRLKFPTFTKNHDT